MPRRSNRADRKRREVARIVGSLRGLPTFFVNGLCNLKRAGLPDAEIRLAYQRCHLWTAQAKKDGFGGCECCGMRLPVSEVNKQNVSVWNLDHCKHSRTFRGVVDQRCNRELGDGNRKRKWSHAEYVEAHESRLRQESGVDLWEFQKPGAMPD
jgi:hypothetical protein